MNRTILTKILQDPLLLKEEHLSGIEHITNEFPYFQAARALYLKGLKNQGNFKYNSELKLTAAHTLDRHVLFDFMTSDKFENSNTFKEPNAFSSDNIATINVKDPDVLIPLPSVNLDEVVKMEIDEANTVLDPSMFAVKPHSKESAQQENEQTLTNTTKKKSSLKKESKVLSDPPQTEAIDINAPLDFTKNDQFSFSEWLKITAITPIKREPEADSSKPVSPGNQEQKQHHSNRKEKSKLIDAFIANNPKIGPVRKEAPKINLAEAKTIPNNALMTETLAKVYLAQKNYKKAIQAYKILILKNPEKSGFFADQIRAIKKLEEKE